jgi:hypothetical protein
MILDDIVTARASCGPSLTAAPPLIDLHVTLSAEEIAARTHAREHVRGSMAHLYGWRIRDIAMKTISKVRRAATDPSILQLSAEEIAALTHARVHVRVCLVPLHCWGDRDAAMAAIGTVLDAARHAAQRGTGSAP